MVYKPHFVHFRLLKKENNRISGISNAFYCLINLAGYIGVMMSRVWDLLLRFDSS